MPQSPVLARGPAGASSRRERRAADRHLCRLLATARRPGAPGDPGWTAVIRDLSVGGMGLVLDAPVEKRTILALTVAGEVKGVRQPLVVRVVHTRGLAGTWWLAGCSQARRLSGDELEALLVSADGQ